MDEFIPEFDDPDDEFSGYFDEEGNSLNPELIQKPGLCLLCVKDDDPNEQMICNLNRYEQADAEGEFKCGGFHAKK